VSDTAHPRISTGNPHLNTILNGGFIAGRPYLIVGPVGSGKTKLALEFLCDGVRRGEDVLLVTLDEPPNELRLNHRAFLPGLDRVTVFDAIPDVIQYEVGLPFVDISGNRRAMPFSDVGTEIRQSPELTCVEVTFGGLEQLLKMEAARRPYSRLVIDSLTALEYFSMKGSDEKVGAQTFLRFLTDIGATTVLTVEAAVEEVESVERLLARGTIRLFRWNLDGRALRAIGIEKFRGSAHDVRLHPYLVTPAGLDIDLALTISRDALRAVLPTSVQSLTKADRPVPLDLSVDIVRLVSDINYLAALGVDVAPVQAELDLARAAVWDARPDLVQPHLSLARAIISAITVAHREATAAASPEGATGPTGAAVDPVPRISTGVPGLDRMTGGGLIPGRPYLVTGGPGTGKTVLGLTFLAEGLRRGEQVLLVAVNEPPVEILENVRSIGWDLSKIQTLDANPGTRRIKGMGDVPVMREIADLQAMGDVMAEGRRATATGEVSLESIHQKLKHATARGQFTRVVVDSITTIRRTSLRTPGDLQARRTEVQSLLRFLSERGATTLVTAMPAEPLTLTPEEVLTRGEILLTRTWIGDRALRYASVVRMRGSAHDPERRPFAITSQGIFLE
jgi:KaiC/GvpD/RAD55 family RecA-like ATPase